MGVILSKRSESKAPHLHFHLHLALYHLQAKPCD